MGFLGERALDTRGTVLVETAITLLPFLILIGGAMDAGRALYAAGSLRYAIHEASRWSVLGQTPPLRQSSMEAANAIVNGMQTCDSNCQRAIYTEQRVGDTLENLGLDRNNLTVKMCPTESPNCAVNNAGVGGKIVFTQGIYRLPMFLYSLTGGASQLSLTSKAYVRNEPF